jgi:DNA-binding NtrC family response regulator
VRLLVATHKDLAEEVKNGNFREDLYYRLLGIPILLPPLRDRDTDIIVLAKHFLNEFEKDNNLHGLKLGRSAQEKLLKYNFPGNVRELKSIIELAVVMSNSEEIEEDDIKFTSLKNEENFTYQELSLKEYNDRIIDHFLGKYDDNVMKVAEILDIGKSTIYRYLKEKSE